MISGIVRRIDDLGRIAIPKDIRRQLEIKEGDALEIAVIGGHLIQISKYVPAEQYASVLQHLMRNIDSDTCFSDEEHLEIMDSLKVALGKLQAAIK